MTYFRPGWDAVPDALREFYDEHLVSTLTTILPDGGPHVVPVGLMLDVERGCAWIVTRAKSRKVRNIEAAHSTPGGARVAVCQVAGSRWSTIEGVAQVVTDADSVARAVGLYAARYRCLDDDEQGVAVRIEVDRILHSPALAGRVHRPATSAVGPPSEG